MAVSLTKLGAEKMQTIKDALTGLAAAIDTFVPAAIREGVDPNQLRSWLLDLYDAEVRPSGSTEEEEQQ